MRLLDEVKQKLRVTWKEEDIRIQKIIDRSKKYLENLCDTKFNFSVEDDPKTLLLERCFYDYNNAINDFEINYGHELARLALNAGLGKIGAPKGE